MNSMPGLNTSAAVQETQSFYSTTINEKDPKKLAGQFESIFYRMIFSEMRKSSAEDEVFGSSEMQQVMGMFDDELSITLGEAGHLGFKDQIVDHMGKLDPNLKTNPTQTQGLLKDPKTS